MDRKQADQEVMRAAEILQLQSLLIAKLEGIERGQRNALPSVAVLRELRAFLFDEPLSNLDAALRVEMRVQIARLHRQLDATMVYVTHDQVEAMTLADRIVVFSEGRIEQIGSPWRCMKTRESLWRPSLVHLKMNILPADRFAYDTTRQRQAGDVVHVGIRPEHAELTKDTSDASLVGQVGVTEHLGSDIFSTSTSLTLAS